MKAVVWEMGFTNETVFVFILCVELFYVLTAAGAVLCKELTDQEKLNCSFLSRF